MNKVKNSLTTFAIKTTQFAFCLAVMTSANAVASSVADLTLTKTGSSVSTDFETTYKLNGKTISVTISETNGLTVSDDKNMDVPEADICIHLARHAVNTEALTLSNRVPTSQRIIETAESSNADLIVAGAWGHKRLREIIFGGVTKTLLSNQKRAVFITH